MWEVAERPGGSTRPSPKRRYLEASYREGSEVRRAPRKNLAAPTRPRTNVSLRQNRPDSAPATAEGGPAAGASRHAVRHPSLLTEQLDPGTSTNPPVSVTNDKQASQSLGDVHSFPHILCSSQNFQRKTDDNTIRRIHCENKPD
ncbi:hypothetical protein SKAU_G00399000 [Synaphobranchus kaupii]|uniref:Uncharacterized protein n=1 Tax=Synaphobranchus kaupii TaxID=118154 RepID=A0A9Q1IC67_SYNKA|nr:hypothetical protein SKAU_G00399000 [Synaphobranchus kaupii]